MDSLLIQIQMHYQNKNINELIKTYNSLIGSNKINPLYFNYKLYNYLLTNVNYLVDIQKIRASVCTEQKGELIDQLVFVSPLIYNIFEKYEN